MSAHSGHHFGSHMPHPDRLVNGVTVAGCGTVAGTEPPQHDQESQPQGELDDGFFWPFRAWYQMATPNAARTRMAATDT